VIAYVNAHRLGAHGFLFRLPRLARPQMRQRHADVRRVDAIAARFSSEMHPVELSSRCWRNQRWRGNGIVHAASTGRAIAAAGRLPNQFDRVIGFERTAGNDETGVGTGFQAEFDFNLIRSLAQIGEFGKNGFGSRFELIQSGLRSYLRRSFCCPEPGKAADHQVTHRSVDGCVGCLHPLLEIFA